MNYELKYNKRRLRSANVSTIVSISLVLFVLGLVGLIVLQAQRLSVMAKENIKFAVILKEGSREADILKLQKKLDATYYIRSTDYITPEDAAKDLTKELGEDFVEFLGYNPLLPTLDVYLKADFANEDSVKVIEKELLKNRVIKEVFYEKSLVTLVNKNIRRISVVLLVFSGLLFIISTALINNTIRLAIYSKRFVIRTMQLVGATPSFIRKPFLLKSLEQGLYASGIAIALLVGTLYLISQEAPELISLGDDSRWLIFLFSAIVIIGLVLTWISTFLGIRRFLGLDLDQLYS